MSAIVRGLYKTECVHADSPFRRSPLRNLDDVEIITADYIAGSTSSASCTASAGSH